MDRFRDETIEARLQIRNLIPPRSRDEHRWQLGGTLIKVSDRGELLQFVVQIEISCGALIVVCPGKGKSDAWLRFSAKFFGMMVARDGVEPPTPAFSGLYSLSLNPFSFNNLIRQDGRFIVTIL